MLSSWGCVRSVKQTDHPMIGGRALSAQHVFKEHLSCACHYICSRFCQLMTKDCIGSLFNRFPWLTDNQCVKPWSWLSLTIQTLADGASSANHTNLWRTSLLEEGSTSASSIVGAPPRPGKPLAISQAVALYPHSNWAMCPSIVLVAALLRYCQRTK